jgi:murein DD-endopeptidase MepM/ murein hydrolase activator NlpD
MFERFPILHLRAITVLMITGLLIHLFWPAQDSEEQRSNASTIPIMLPSHVFDQPERADPKDDTSPKIPTWTWQEESISPGDNLSVLFKRKGIPASVLLRVTKAADDNDLKRLAPGQKLEFGFDSAGEFSGLRLKRDLLTTTEILLNEEGQFTASTIEAPSKIRPIVKVGHITKKQSSLYLAGQSIEISDKLIMELANLFQWDISFALDLRRGDQFLIVYEGIYSNDTLIHEGNILAAHFSNMGQQYEAYRYTDPSGKVGYFDADGISLRKAFIRDPVHFSHVSSRFNLSRMHPIHNRKMPHRGIDYAAARGTPVKAAGDGKVISATSNEASGKFIVLQHGERYTTKYLHLSNFANNIRRGSNVKQGQVIGFVGSTGWATGPHLHYEFLVSGSHQNPRTVKLPDAAPVAPIYEEDFRAHISGLQNQLQNHLAQVEAVPGSQGSTQSI